MSVKLGFAGQKCAGDSLGRTTIWIVTASVGIHQKLDKVLTCLGIHAFQTHEIRKLNVVSKVRHQRFTTTSQYSISTFIIK